MPLNRILGLVAFVIGIIGVFVTALYAINENESMLSLAFTITFILIAIALLGFLVGSFLGTANDSKEGLKGVITLVGTLVIFGIGFALAKGTSSLAVAAEKGLSSGTLKLIGGGFTAFVILLAIAIVAMLVDMVKSATE